MIIYEPHSFKEKKLPFIFHFDTLSPIIPSEDAGDSIEHLYYRQRCMQNWHENTEILFVTKGKGRIYCNSERIEIEEGDIAVINSFDLHYTETDKSMEYYCLIPDRAYLQQNGLNTSLIRFRNVVKDEKTIGLFKNIIREFEEDGRYKEAGIKLAVNELILYMARYYTNPEEGKRDSKTLHYMRMAIGYINSHLHERITADDVADEIGLSKYHFLREFKRITNTTLVEFINGLRCEKAMKMLREENIPIAEISALCGFENGSYFNKIFKSETGMSMSEYRRNARKESE